ncbi:MAG: magnesium transporter CorA family protein [Chlamydiota bacterium]
MLQYYHKTGKDEDFIPLNEPKEGCWIHIEEASIEDLTRLSTIIDLEYSDLQDALDKYEVPRIERIHHHILLFVRCPSEQEAGLYTTTLTIVLTTHYFITISPQINTLIKTYLQKKTKQSTQQRPTLLTALLFRVAQEFTSEIKKVRYNVLGQEKEIIKVDSDDITTLTKSEEILNQYFSSLAPFRAVLEEIITGKFHNLYEKDHDKINDLLNAVKQSEDLCSIVLKSIRSLRDAYQIIFTNNLHKTIKLLTALTIIFSIPTMIASLYGMNVSLPLARSSHAFTLIMLIIFGISIFGLWIFKKKRWL